MCDDDEAFIIVVSRCWMLHAIFRILKMATHLSVISIFYCLSVDSFVQFYQKINAINYVRYFLGNEMFCEQNLLLFKRASYSRQYHLIFPCTVFTISCYETFEFFTKKKCKKLTFIQWFWVKPIQSNSVVNCFDCLPSWPRKMIKKQWTKL